MSINAPNLFKVLHSNGELSTKTWKRRGDAVNHVRYNRIQGAHVVEVELSEVRRYRVDLKMAQRNTNWGTSYQVVESLNVTEVLESGIPKEPEKQDLPNEEFDIK